MVGYHNRADLNLVQPCDQFDLPRDILWVVEHGPQVEVSNTESDLKAWCSQVDRVLGSEGVLQLGDVDVGI